MFSFLIMFLVFRYIIISTNPTPTFLLGWNLELGALDEHSTTELLFCLPQSTESIFHCSILWYRAESYLSSHLFLA